MFRLPYYAWMKNVLDLLGLVRCRRVGSEQRPTSEAVVSTDAMSFRRPIMQGSQRSACPNKRSPRPIAALEWTVHESLGLCGIVKIIKQPEFIKLVVYGKHPKASFGVRVSSSISPRELILTSYFQSWY
jgi:hypothetical protein